MLGVILHVPILQGNTMPVHHSRQTFNPTKISAMTFYSQSIFCSQN